MQRPSWDLLRKNWADLFFFEPLSEFINRLHEDRGAELQLLAMFDPVLEEVPPAKPPIYLLLLYNREVDLIKENLFLKEHDPSGMFDFFSYSVDAFRRMIKENNPVAVKALQTGVVLFEKDNILDTLAN